jgi:hypothetical protein
LPTPTIPTRTFLELMTDLLCTARRVFSFQAKRICRPHTSGLDLFPKRGCQRLKKVCCSARIPDL